jgi:cysteine desulfurase
MRSGTLNVPGIVGLGKACELCESEFGKEISQVYSLRERLRDRLQHDLPDVTLNGSLEYRLPGNLNLSFAHTEPGALLRELIKKIAVSSGSACTSATPEPSYCLRAIGVGDNLAYTSIRFGIGRFTTEEEVDFAAGEVVKAVKHLRGLSSLRSAS